MRISDWSSDVCSSDLEARKFYGELLGCGEGRSAEHWVDFDFFGHQVVAHLAPEECGTKAFSSVDDHQVPAKHFGVILTIPAWKALAEKLTAAGTKFIIEPYVRFEGEEIGRASCRERVCQYV